MRERRRRQVVLVAHVSCERVVLPGRESNEMVMREPRLSSFPVMKYWHVRQFAVVELQRAASQEPVGEHHQIESCSHNNNPRYIRPDDLPLEVGPVDDRCVEEDEKTYAFAGRKEIKGYIAPMAVGINRVDGADPMRRFPKAKIICPKLTVMLTVTTGPAKVAIALKKV